MRSFIVVSLLSLLVAAPAFSQGIQPLEPLPTAPAGGYLLDPSGGITSWQDGSGYSVAPGGGTSS
jgi:hypothetical protein